MTLDPIVFEPYFRPRSGAADVWSSIWTGRFRRRAPSAKPGSSAPIAARQPRCGRAAGRDAVDRALGVPARRAHRPVM